MPLYEYECAACGALFDRLASVADADDVACARCGAPDVRRLLSVIGGLGGRTQAPAPSCGGGACAACS